MRRVAAGEFIALLRAHGSPTLRERLDRLDPARLLGGHADSCFVHDGDFAPSRNWQPEPANLIVLGSVVCRGLVDLAPKSASVDEGGSFWVLGDLECGHFAGYYGKGVFVDGHMTVSGIAVTAFENSCLVVAGDFRARYFHGDDMWVEAGGTISLEYGKGYGLPIAFTDAAAQAVYPRHDAAASLAFSNLRNRKDALACVARISNGESFPGAD